MRLAILGNAGSGKSTLARWASERMSAPSLDLDTVAWEPGPDAVPRGAAAARADVEAFCRRHRHWVVEGCYASLVAAALPHGPRLVLLDPGEAQCLANCRSRPWEPHKHASREAQDGRLAALLAWVSAYYAREGEMSLAGHRALFEAYDGPKSALRRQPRLDPPAPELLAWLA
ncbi:MAG: shikimate kinase [Stenotrophomonas sp.]